MIDIHNHILPGVDDGAKTIEESRANGAGSAAAWRDYGLRYAPHALSGRPPATAASIRQKVEELQHDFDSHGIDLQILVGSEVQITPTLARDVRERRVPTLNGSNYLLLEFPYDQLPQYYQQVIFELQLDGIIPIIAHPERIMPLG